MTIKCPYGKGHDAEESDFYHYPNGKRRSYCKACHKKWTSERYARLKGKTVKAKNAVAKPQLQSVRQTGLTIEGAFNIITALRDAHSLDQLLECKRMVDAS